MQPHESGYTIMPHSHTLVLEFLPYSGTAVSSSMLFLDYPNLLHQGSILISSCRYRSFSPCIVPRCTHSKHPRHLLDRPPLYMVNHKPVDHFRFSLTEKIATAFFSISFVSRKSAISFRRLNSSSSRGLPCPGNAFFPESSWASSRFQRVNNPESIPKSRATDAALFPEVLSIWSALRFNSAG